MHHLNSERRGASTRLSRYDDWIRELKPKPRWNIRRAVKNNLFNRFASSRKRPAPMRFQENSG